MNDVRRWNNKNNWRPLCWLQVGYTNNVLKSPLSHLFELITWIESKRIDPENWTAKGTAKMMGLQKWNYFQRKNCKIRMIKLHGSRRVDGRGGLEGQ